MDRNTPKYRWLAGIALTASLAIFAACGSDNATDSAVRGDGAPGGALSRDEVKSNADSISESDAARIAGAQAYDASGEAPAPSTGSVPQGDASGAESAALLGRKQILSAIITIETDQVSRKFEEIGAIAVSSGGLVFSSSYGNDGERQTASATIRVPSDRYQDVLVRLRDLGVVTNEDSDTTDVTGEFTDLQSRLTNLQASEREYLKLLARAGTIEEILVVQDRINNERAQIEQVQGRINLLEDQTDLATITVHLTPPVAGKSAPDDGGAQSPLEVAEKAFEASLAVLLGIATVALAVGAFSWWLLPLAGAGWYFGRRQMRADRERRQTPPA
jgi:hypothetical protein